MIQIRPIERADLPAILREPYSVSIAEPGDRLGRLRELFGASGFWQEDAGAVAIDDHGLKGTIQFFRRSGYELGCFIHDRLHWGRGLASDAQLLSDRLFDERPRIVRHQLTIACGDTAS